MSFLSTSFPNPKLNILICIYSSYSRSAQNTPFQASMVCVCRKVQIRPYNVWFLLLLSQRCVTAFYTVSLSHYSSKFSSRSYDGLWLFAWPDDTRDLTNRFCFICQILFFSLKINRRTACSLTFCSRVHMVVACDS